MSETENQNVNNDVNNNNKEKEEEDANLENELKQIIERDPLEELKIIQEKIRLENKKINEIDSRIDIIKKGKKLIKRPYELNNDLINSINSLTNIKKNSNNILSYNTKPKLTEKNVNISNSLEIPKITPHNSNLILEKMKELKNQEIINIKNDKKIDLSLKKDPKYRINIDQEMEKLIEMEKEEKKKIYENKIKKFHDNELELEKKRKKIIDQMTNIPLNQRNKINQKKYYYISAIEKEEIRKQNEEFLLKMEKEKRKQKYLPISSEELNNFSKEVIKNKKLLDTELSLKKKQMEDLWKERKNLLPKYHSKFMDLNIEYDKEAKEESLLKQEKLKSKEIERMNFGKEVVKNHLPKKLNDKLKAEREQKIKELKGVNRLNNIKELGNKLKEKSKRLVLSQPKNFNKNNIFVPELSIKDKLSKKLITKNIDYLQEQRIKSDKKKKDLDKMPLYTEGNNAVNNLGKIKLEKNLMNNKINDINKLTKIESRNNSENHEINKKISNYYINSIQDKLKKLNEIMLNT